MEQNEVVKSEDFSTMAVAVELFKWKWFIIAFTLIITIGAAIYAFKLPNWYASTVSLVPPKSSGSMLESAMGNIGSVLKEFGMTKLGNKGGDNYSYTVILNSRTIKDSIINHFNLAKEYGMENLRYSAVRDAFDDNLEISLENDGNFFITIYDQDPNKAVEMVNYYYQLTNSLSQNIFRNESRINREYLETRLKSTDETIIKISDTLQAFSANKKIISPMEQAKAVSAALSELKAEQMKQDIVYQLLKNKYGEQDPTTKLQKTSIEELNKKINEAETKPGFAGNFSLDKSGEVGIKYLKLYAQLETFTKVKTFLLPMLEEAKLNEYRETYSLFVLDKPLPADKKSRPKRSVILGGAAIGSFAFSLFLVVIIYNLRIFSRKLKQFKSKN